MKILYEMGVDGRFFFGSRIYIHTVFHCESTQKVFWELFSLAHFSNAFLQDYRIPQKSPQGIFKFLTFLDGDFFEGGGFIEGGGF